MGGVARRAWARNPHSIETSMDYNKKNANIDHITLPYLTDDAIISKAIEQVFNK